MSERFKELVLKTSDPKGPWVRIPLSPPFSYDGPINSDLEKYPSGRRGSPAKGVGRVERREGSNPSFSATESLETVRFQGFPFLRPASVFAAGKPLGGTKERHLLLADVSLSWQGVTIQILSGRSNSLAFKFAIFLEKHLTGLLAGSAFAPYKRFTTGKTLAQGEFTSPEHFNH